MARATAEAKAADRAKGEFLANMSHELRTPLNAILGMTETLQEEIHGEINAAQCSALKAVETGGLHLLELINDILDLAKIEAGKVELEISSGLPIDALCQSSLALIRQQAIKKRLQLETSIEPNLPNVQIDVRRMRQALANLLSNAVKFTPEGGKITLSVSHYQDQEVADEDRQHTLQITVSDTGIGISPEYIERLFEPLVQVDSALNRKYEGTGLGLSLVRRIVELHGGTVGVVSEVGRGSHFTICLPYSHQDWNQAKTSRTDETTANAIAANATAVQTTAVQTTTVNSEEATVGQSGAARVILLAEDNEANITTFSNYLRAKGYRVALARTGQEAIEQIQTVRPDLVLMDMQMPIVDGMEAIVRIRKLPDFANLPIIALTALAMEGDRDRCLAAGATDYLCKPVKLRQLSELVQKRLAVNADSHEVNQETHS